MVYHPFYCEDFLLKKKSNVMQEKKRKIDKDFQGHVDSEINARFDSVKRRKKNIVKNSEEITSFVEKVMTELQIVAEDDAQLNREGQPASNKLKKLPFLNEVLSKKSFQLEFMDHGVLTILKNWLEPLPDGSLPNANVRCEVLMILTDFPLDLREQDQREQLKKSGLGKVIMFLSKSEEQIVSNEKLAKDLIDKWSRIIYNKSTRFSDLRNTDDVCIPPMMKKGVNNKPAIMEYSIEPSDFDRDFIVSKEKKQISQSSCSSQCALRPKLTPSVYLVNLKFKPNLEIIKVNCRKQDIHERIDKRFKLLKALKKKSLQAQKPSAQGRAMLLSF